MKKTMLLLAIIFYLPIHAQQLSDSTSIFKTSESIVIQKSDNISEAKIKIIEDRLTSFYKGNRASQYLILGGAAFYILGIFTAKSTMIGDVNIVQAFGGACGLIGGIIYLDSFNPLKFNKKKDNTSIYW